LKREQHTVCCSRFSVMPRLHFFRGSTTFMDGQVSIPREVRMNIFRTLIVAGLCVARWAPAEFVHTKEADGTYNVTQFHAVGDGVTLDTAAIQAAIGAAATQGGGEVVFPPGRFLTGTLYLKDRVALRLLQGATILGSANLADYPANHCKYPSWSDQYTARALIWGEGLQDIAITGSGTIDGQGVFFRDNVATPEELEGISKTLGEEGRYAPNKVYYNRPYLVRFISCRNVLVENVSMRNSAMWMQHYLDCDFVTLRGIKVFNHGCANNDMIDIDGCRNVIVSDCFGDSDDDALTLKSTGARPTEHVAITNCVLRSHCSAIKAGTESSGGFKDIAISNCVIQRSSVPQNRAGRPEGLAGIALEIVDGGALERVAISNLVIEGTTAPLFMRLGNRARTIQPDLPKPPAGVFRDVSIDNLVATGASPTGCAIAGLPGHCIENVTLSNIRIAFTGPAPENIAAEVPEKEDQYPECAMFGTLPAYGFYCRHVNGLQLRGIELGGEAPGPRPAIVADDVHDLRIDGLSAEAAPGTPAQVVLRDTTGAWISGSTAAVAKTFLSLENACSGIRLTNNDLSSARKPYLLGPSTPASAVVAEFNLLPEAGKAGK